MGNTFKINNSNEILDYNTPNSEKSNNSIINICIPSFDKTLKKDTKQQKIKNVNAITEIITDQSDKKIAPPKTLEMKVNIKPVFPSVKLIIPNNLDVVSPRKSINILETFSPPPSPNNLTIIPSPKPTISTMKISLPNTLNDTIESDNISLMSPPPTPVNLDIISPKPQLQTIKKPLSVILEENGIQNINTIICNLKTIRGIKQGDKLCVSYSGELSIDTSYMPFLTRTLYGNNRNVTIDEVVKTINNGKKLFCYYPYLTNLYDTMLNKGINNLILTYKDNETIQQQLNGLI